MTHRVFFDKPKTMKLLLTSGGMKNKSIANALRELLGKPFEESSLAFIPTAADVKSNDKSWLVTDLYKFHQLGFKTFDIVDIAALPFEIFMPHLEAADVIVFGGGHTYFFARHN